MLLHIFEKTNGHNFAEILKRDTYFPLINVIYFHCKWFFMQNFTIFKKPGTKLPVLKKFSN